MNPWEAERICYIKLGERGRWADKCFKDGELRFGFNSGTQEVLAYAEKNEWEKLRQYWLLKVNKAQVATSYTNQTRSYFEDVGTTLWITLENGYLYYGFTDGVPTPDSNSKEFDGAELSSHKKWTLMDGKKLMQKARNYASMN